MVVDQGTRRKGIGKSLLSRLEEIAKSRDCSQIILVTELERVDACLFYEACGFTTNNKGYKKKL